MKAKRFKYDVYSPSGVYITTWNDVITDPTFATQINGGLSEMVLKLARNADDFGESNDVAFKNQVRVYAFDGDSADGVKIFTGFISGYTPTLNEKEEYIEISILGYSQELSKVELLDNGSGIQDSPTLGNTTLVYNSKDPSNILKDVIDKYRALTGVSLAINYATGSIDLTGTTVSYTFSSTTILDAINKILQLAPDGWYWYLDENNVIQFHQFSTNPDYTLYVKKDVKSISPTKRIENIKNVVYITGKTPLFKVYQDTISIGLYGRNADFLVDQRVSVNATAQIMSDRDMQTVPEVRTQLVVVDNNNDDGKGFDIELLKPGKMINVLNFLSKKIYSLWGVMIWGVDKWGYDIANVSALNVAVIKVQYTPDQVSLEISSLLPQISHRIEDVDRNWKNNLLANNASAPS